LKVCHAGIYLTAGNLWNPVHAFLSALSGVNLNSQTPAGGIKFNLPV
jgi:hypothetical protein